MCFCDVILIISAILFVTSVIVFGITYKIGKDENRHRPCGGGRHNA